MTTTVDKTKRIGRWYFGGVASAMAACCTHPLDLLKVHMQTQQGQISIFLMAKRLYKSDGVLGFYNGLSASVLRQLTYSMTRFAVYDVGRKALTKDGRHMPFYEKVLLAGTAGAMGGFVGTPPDMVNVRMQNDVKLAPEQRRNYKHALDGLYRVFKEEGPVKMFNGATMATSRAVLVTVGQIAFYDQIKGMLLGTAFFKKDNEILHFTSSFCAGGIATLLTMPLDVMKTRMMNAPPGKYKNILACAIDIGKNGPLGFFKVQMGISGSRVTVSAGPRLKPRFPPKQLPSSRIFPSAPTTSGFMPAFVRLGPHTILTFMFLEQIRMNFGDDPKN